MSNLTEIKEIVCPICKAKKINDLFIKEGIHYFSCKNCGFEFSVTKENANLKNAMGDFETPYLQYFEDKAADLKNHASLLKWVTKHANKNMRSFLDVGSGSGKWVRFLEKKGFEVCGVEPSSALYENFLNGKGPFFPGTIDRFANKYPEKKFDVITAFDVLEHVKDPISFLEHIAALMHPHSLLFISIPDNKSLHRKIAGKRWHYFNKYHFSYFNKQTLCIAGNKAGLGLVHHSHRTRYFQTNYITNYVKSFLLGFKTKRRTGSPGFVLPLNLFDNLYCVFKKECNNL